MVLGVPVVYARKTKPITMAGPVFLETAPSHTKGGEVNLLVSAEFLHAGENVLIIDDFLATGKTLLALARMVRSAKANIVGVGVVVEKTFEGGRNLMLQAGYTNIPIEALAIITSMEDGKIMFAV
jgi:xanthine phosphoribosyltransferase